MVTFGRTGDADVRAEDVVLGPDGRAAFDLVTERPAASRFDSRCRASTWWRTRSRRRRSGIELGVPLDECRGGAVDRDASSPWRMETFDADAACAW